MIRCTINAAVRQIVWTDVDAAETATLHVDRLSPQVREFAMFDRLRAKVTDAAAIERDTATGRSAPVSEKFAAMRGMIDWLESGTTDWNRKGAGGGDALLWQAVVEAGLTRKDGSVITDTADARAKFRALAPGQRKALAQDARVKPVYDRLVAEATAGVDVEATLDTL